MTGQRLIDANALIPKLKLIRGGETQIYGINSFDFSGKCITAVEDAPTIEEHKNGKWIREGSVFNLRCPYCEKFFVEPVGSKFNFCPHCSADMRGKEGK